MLRWPRRPPRRSRPRGSSQAPARRSAAPSRPSRRRCRAAWRCAAPSPADRPPCSQRQRPRSRLPPPSQVGLSENEAKLASLSTLPTLVVHAAGDVLVPAEQATLLHAALGSASGVAAVPKRLELVSGAGHNDLVYTPAYREALSRFIDQTLGAPTDKT